MKTLANVGGWSERLFSSLFLGCVLAVATAQTATPPKFYIVGKTVSYSQASAGSSAIDSQTPWSTILVAIGFAADDFSAVAVQRPGLPVVPLQFSPQDGMWGQADEAKFATEAALNAEYPNSTSPYTFNFTPGGGGAVINSPLVLNGATYPAAPHISNYAAAQTIDPNQSFTLTWDAFAGGTAGDAILVFVYGNNGPDVFSSPFPGAPGALTGTATSVQIPAGALRPGRTYECEVLFLKIVNQRTGDIADATGYASYATSTAVPFVTTGTAVGPLSTEFQLEFQHTQGSVVGTDVTNNFPVTTSYQPMFIAEDDPNPPASVIFTGPAGSQLQSGVASTGFYTWGNNGRAYYPNTLTTGPSPLQYPPGGAYTVAYGGGTNYPFTVASPDAAARQVVAVPSFTINGSGALTAVSWSLRTPAGVVTTVPASFVRASVNLNAGGNNYYYETTPAAGTMTLGTPVQWSTVTWVSIQHVDNLSNSYRSDYQVSQASVPSVTSNPVTQTVSAAGSVTLSVSASGAPAPTYQWQLNGVNIPGATGSSYTIPNTQQFHAGAYRVVVTNTAGSVNSASATLTVQEPPASNARLTNLSTRALCLTGDNVLIPGFVVAGPGNKQLLIRAIGPTLGAFGVPGTLPDPRLTLKLWNGAAYVDVATNDNWGTNANVAQIITKSAELFAFALNNGSADSALLVDLAPGQYSVVAGDVGTQTGIAMVELYDADTAGTTSRLSNISNRGYVGAGDSIMIPGFVVSSEGSKTLLVRAVGPTLGVFGVAGVLADPTLAIYQHDSQSNTDNLILTNDDWSAGPGATRTEQVAGQVFAFALPSGSKDAAFVVTLNPGIYTVHARGVAGATGVALVEVYVVP